MTSRIAWSLLLLTLAGPVAAQPAPPTLTFTAQQLLSNDTPGPPNEAVQSLTITSVRTSAASHGTATLANGVVSYVPEAGFFGTAQIFYTACDNGATNGQPDPRCSEGTITINVVANRVPTATSQSLTTAEDTAIGVPLAAADADGDALNFRIVTQPSHGTLSGTAPLLTYTPAPDFNGSDTFTFAANDGFDESVPATVTFTVTEVNDVPVGQIDSTVAAAGKRLTLLKAFLLGNDVTGPFNENGQTLTLTTITAGPNTHGIVSLGIDDVAFDPDAAFVGTAVIEYAICDNGTTNGQPDQLCAGATLTVVLNGPPAAQNQAKETIRTAPVPIVLSATDPENDSLTFAIVAGPQHGTLSGTAPTLTYVANSGFVGNDSFTFTAADAYSTSSTATVSIVIKDPPPVLLSGDSLTVPAGGNALVDVLANDTPGTGSFDPATLAVSAVPSKGVAVVETGRIRYTANAGASGDDGFSYTVCDEADACGSAFVTVTITAFENHPPTGNADTYDITAGTTLNVPAPGVLANDSDADAGDTLQARLVRGVTNGQLLLVSNGAFTYTPNGPGLDTFVYHILDSHGGVSNDVTVSIFVNGTPGPPTAGNDLYTMQQGRELAVAAPGVLANDTSPNPRLVLTSVLRTDAAKGALFFNPDGSFVYAPEPGFTGVDQFSYVARDSEGRTSQVANVGITVTGGGPPTPVVSATSPAAGSVVTQPIHFTATLVPPPGESIPAWTVSYGRPGDAFPVLLAAGSGPNVGADFDPTLLRNGTYAIIVRAEASGGGVLVSETGLIVDGNYKPGRYTTTYRDFSADAPHMPLELLRTYDSADKVDTGLGVGWSLQISQFRVDTNGALGSGGWSAFTCGSFPFLATCYTSSVPHFVTITWPDGHLERFRFAPNQGSQLVPTITTAAFEAEPGTTSTLEAADGRLVLVGQDFLLGDFFSIEGIFDPAVFILTDRFGTQYTLDRRGGVLGIRDRNGNELTLDDDGILGSSGVGVQFTRDAHHRIAEIATPTGVIEYTYSAAGDLVGVQYPSGATQEFTYDARHNLLSTRGDGQLVQTLHYDASGRITSVTDGNGNTATIANDLPGRQEVVTDPSGTLTTISTHDTRGNVVRQDRVAAGKTITTSATYDVFDRQLSRTDGTGRTTSQTYDAAGNVLTQTDAGGHVTAYTHNAFGQALAIIDPLGHITTNVYDANGNLVRTIAPDGGNTTYTHDAFGNVLTKTDPTSRVTTYTYDAFGRLASTTDPNGHTTHQTAHAGSGKVTSMTDATGAATSFGYDARGNLIRVTDPNGHSRTATYDAFDRLTSQTDSTGARTTSTYDAAGNLTSLTDRNGQSITFAYDANARLVSKTVPGAGTVTYTYDGFGRRVALANQTARLTFTYDDADRILSATSTPITAGALPTTTFSYTYDQTGRVTSVQSAGGTTAYAYDVASRLTTLTDPAGGALNLGYDAVGRQTSMTRPNGVNDTAVYDLAGRLTSLRSVAGQTLLNQADYAYDPAGRRTAFTSTAGTASYAYDAASQLIAANFPAGTGLSNEQYTYDPAGNRTSSVSSPLGSYTYDNANRLLADATATYQYDNEGNLLARTIKATGATTQYSWTAEHQLIGITYPDSSTSTFLYDPVGRRVAIEAGIATARYAYDGEAIAAEYDATNTLVATYVHNPRSPTTTYEMTRGGQRYFLLTDALESTTALVTASGAVANSYAYTAFGTPTQTGTVANPFSYTGQLFHQKAGLFLFPLRAYDPSAGRFLSEDPIPSLNPYPYVQNNPMNATDPTGAGTAENAAARSYILRLGYHFHRLPATRAECFAAFFGYYAIRAGFGTASGGFSVPAGSFEMIYQQTWVWCGLLP